MSAYIYIEGGAMGPGSKEVSLRCQQAFHKLLDKMGFKGKMPRLKACGGRQCVYDDFCIAHSSRKSDYIAMWIDSEDPMTDVEQAWTHLASVTTVPPWIKPLNATDEQVLFMTTCMETWIIADRATLRQHYGAKLQETALPSLTDLEKRDRHAIQGAIINSTRKCSNAFKKGERSYAVLGKLNPAALSSLPSFARVARVLKQKLKQ